MENRIFNSRVSFEMLGKNYPSADDVEIIDEFIEGVCCYWITNKEWTGTNKLIIYLHGGCFVLGSINSHKALVTHIASLLKTPVLFVEYSLAPENPYPSAIEEILEVYQNILDRNAYGDLSFIGDSAGAGLAVSVISDLNKRKIPIPQRLIMLSPWIDLRNQTNSMIQKAAEDPILKTETLDFYATLYSGNKSLSEANPAEGFVGPFPPTLILVGSNEILLDDSRIAYSVIAKQQPDTRFKIYKGQTHVWMLDDIHSKESKDALQEINKFSLLRKSAY